MKHRFTKRALSWLLAVMMAFASLVVPAMAANSNGDLTAEVVSVAGEYFLSVQYISGNNSIKEATFEVLSPGGELLLASPVVSFILITNKLIEQAGKE